MNELLVDTLLGSNEVPMYTNELLMDTMLDIFFYQVKYPCAWMNCFVSGYLVWIPSVSVAECCVAVVHIVRCF